MAKSLAFGYTLLKMCILASENNRMKLGFPNCMGLRKGEAVGKKVQEVSEVPEVQRFNVQEVHDV